MKIARQEIHDFVTKFQNMASLWPVVFVFLLHEAFGALNLVVIPSEMKKLVGK